MNRVKRPLSLRRKCFGKSNLHQTLEPDLHGTSGSVESDGSTSDDDAHTPTLFVEDVDFNVQSPTPRRKLGSANMQACSPSGDTSHPLDMKQQHCTLHQSVSGSSIDSGLGLSRNTSLSSLPHSKRSSREVQDISSPLVESRRLASTEGQQPRIPKADLGDKGAGEDITADASRKILVEEESEDRIITTEEEEGDFKADRDSENIIITKKALDDLRRAVERMVLESKCPNEAPLGGVLSKAASCGSTSTSHTEIDGPHHGRVHRHSSADPDILLTQRPSKMLERKRSAQPLFHCSPSSSRFNTEENSGCRERKKSVPNVSERKERKTSRSGSAPSVIIRTAMTPHHQKKRRYSEVLKVYKPSEIPFTEVRLMKIEEWRDRISNGMDRRKHICKSLSRKQAPPLPDTTTPSNESEMVPMSEEERDKRLQEILESNMPKFLEYTNWTILFSHLFSKRLLNQDSRETLNSLQFTSTVKGNYFYGQALPRMGHEATPYIKLCECLDATKTEHLGHATLVNLLHSCDTPSQTVPNTKNKTL